MVFDEEKELADALSAEATDRAAGVPGIADDLSVATWNGYEDETTGTYGVTASPWLLDSEDDLGDVADSSHGPRAQYRPDPRISGIVADGHMFHVRTFSNPDTPASCAHCGDQLLAGDDTSRCELAEGEAPTLKGRRGMHVWGVPVLAPVKDRPGWWYKRPTGPVRPVETLSAFRIRGKGTVVLDPGVHDVPRPGTLVGPSGHVVAGLPDIGPGPLLAPPWFEPARCSCSGCIIRRDGRRKAGRPRKYCDKALCRKAGDAKRAKKHYQLKKRRRKVAA